MRLRRHFQPVVESDAHPHYAVVDHRCISSRTSFRAVNDSNGHGDSLRYRPAR